METAKSANVQVKICGITQPEQGRAIAQLGATALGFICTDKSARYCPPEQIRAVIDAIPVQVATHYVGVFVNASLDTVLATVATAGLTAVQLHGDESPQHCLQLRQASPQLKIIKALRVRDAAVLKQVDRYAEVVDAFLLDAYHATLHGGTGHTLDWLSLRHFQPGKPWFLAGGLTPENVLEALGQVNPDGIDLSSGVETASGIKDLSRVTQLFESLGQAAVPPQELSGRF